MAQLEGYTVGSWQLQRSLGGGAHGEVYLVEQIASQRQAVMRILQVRPSVEHPTVGVSLAGRFVQEVQRLIELRHRYILPLYEYGQQNEWGYLVMAYAPDGSLQDAFTPGRPPFRFHLPLSPQTVSGLLDQLAAALSFAHERGVVHGGIKPGNMLLAPDARGNLHLLLSDFGLARLFVSAASTAVSSGSLFYTAPEALTLPPTFASDQYSLGVVIYQLLTGKLPFGGDASQIMQQHLQVTPTSLCSLNPKVSPAVEHVVLRALAKDPRLRWPNVATFATAYREAVAGGSSAAILATPGQWPGTLASATPAVANLSASAPQPLIAPQPWQAVPARPPAGSAPQPATAQPLAPAPDHAVASGSWGVSEDNAPWVREPPTLAAAYQPAMAQPASAISLAVLPRRRSRTPWLVLGGAGAMAVILTVVLVLALVLPRSTAATKGGAGVNPGPTPGTTTTATADSSNNPTSPTGPQRVMTDKYVTAIATTTDPSVVGDGMCSNTFPASSTKDFQTGDTVMIVYTANLTQDQANQGLRIDVDKVDNAGVATAFFAPNTPDACAGKHTYVASFDTNADQAGAGMYKVEIRCISCNNGDPDATIFFQVG